MNSSPAFNPPSAAGHKRKRTGFYSVHRGRQPGVYDTWDECKAQVDGFTGAVFKKFETFKVAEEFVNAIDNPTAGATGVNRKWYAVQVGRAPGIYNNWHTAHAQITGIDNAKHKAFDSPGEARDYLQQGQQTVTSSSTPDATAAASPPTSNKKVKLTKASSDKDDTLFDLAKYAPGEAPLPPGTEDGFDNTLVLDIHTLEMRYRTPAEIAEMKRQAVRPVEDAELVIHTDGASLGNGQHGAMAGVGVYFGPRDQRNVSSGLEGNRQTNQRAELTAVLRALELAPKDRIVRIKTDSRYAISCVTEWYQKWQTNNWHNAAGKPVENKDLISKIIDLLQDRMDINAHRGAKQHDDKPGTTPWDRGPAAVRFEWVKGHANDEGNIAADALATAGARAAKEMFEASLS